MEDSIDLANSKTLAEFLAEYLPPRLEWQTWTHLESKAQYQISLSTPEGLSLADFNACFNLIDFTSSKDYKKSQDGWKPRSKRKEMKLLDLKYILVKNKQCVVEGFASLMPTHEDGYAVVYCYEIHLASALQGTGLGTMLMQMLESVGFRIPGVQKTMLTCFTCNERAVKFYEKLGFTKDEFSPPPKILRNGTIVESEYVILSKLVLR